jgi:hypothetical protein
VPDAAQAAKTTSDSSVINLAMRHAMWHGRQQHAPALYWSSVIPTKLFQNYGWIGNYWQHWQWNLVCLSFANGYLRLKTQGGNTVCDYPIWNIP